MMYNTGFTCGAFDLLHTGHVLFLNECAKQCDTLYVGLQSNPQIDRASKNQPVQSLFERWMQLDALWAVDMIVPYDTEHDLENMLATLPITVRFLDSQYELKTATGQSICQFRNIPIIYIPRLHDYSSSELRKRVWAREWKQS